MNRRLLTMALALAIGVTAPALQAQGPREGIVVHGHWVVDVRSSDGTLVNHVEFENSLAGKDVLMYLLTRKNVLGGWEIMLRAPLGGPGICGNEFCRIGENVPVYATDTSTNLVVTDDFLTKAVILSGSMTATSDGSFNLVYTNVQRCFTTHATTDQCLNATPQGPSDTMAFTIRALDAPIPVANGQIVQVKVVLTFS